MDKANTKKPSSRKRTRYDLKKGDLVRVNTSRRKFKHIWLDHDQLPIALVVEVYPSNIYEPAAADVIMGEDTMFIERKRLTLISED